jgi:hypothetical protein
VNGDIDLAVEQRLLNLLYKQPFTADLGERPVDNLVATDLDDDQLDLKAGVMSS